MAELQEFDTSHGRLSISLSAQCTATFLSICLLGVNLLRRPPTVRDHPEIGLAPIQWIDSRLDDLFLAE